MTVMTGEDHAPPDEYYEESWDCDRCEGSGMVMSCCDDICRNTGECMWGEGRAGCFMRCFECKGTGMSTRKTP